MIKNFWDHVTFYCINGHEEPVPMVVMEGSTPFYACPKYMLKDAQHPDGHEPDERACGNRISFTRATTVMEKFMKIMEADDAEGNVCDYTGMTFNFDGITVKILKYDPHETKIGILNRRVIK